MHVFCTIGKDTGLHSLQTGFIGGCRQNKDYQENASTKQRNSSQEVFRQWRFLPTIHQGSQINAPLAQLTGNHKIFNWNEDCQMAFEEIKDQLGHASILKEPEMRKEFHLHTNASLVTLGAVLAQTGEKGIDMLVDYIREYQIMYMKGIIQLQRGRPRQ